MRQAQSNLLRLGKLQRRLNAFAAKLLDAGVAVTPGVGFGEYGEGYVRITFTQPKERIVEACNRIASAF